jgi:hypothetical protein
VVERTARSLLVPMRLNMKEATGARGGLLRFDDAVTMRNVLVLQMAERRKQLPCTGTVAARTIYVRHDLLLLLDVTATDSDVLLGIIKISLLHRAVHAVLLLLSNQVLLLVRPSVRGLLFPKRSCSPPSP